jgi:acetyl esterase/lipase
MVALSTHTREWTSAEWGDESEAVSACCALHPVSNLIGIGEGLDPDAVAAHDSESSPEALLVNGVSFTGRGDGPIASVPEKAEAASPAGLLIRKPADVKAPPFLLIHGTADRMVSPAQSAHMAELLKEAHVPFRYYLLEGVDHSSDPAWYQEPICDLIVKFFEKKLGD